MFSPSNSCSVRAGDSNGRGRSANSLPHASSAAATCPRGSVFTSGFDVQCTGLCFHQQFEVIRPEVHEDRGFHYARQSKCTAPNALKLTDGRHAIEHLRDKVSAFFLQPPLLNLSATGFLILNILRARCLTRTVNRRTQ